MDLATFVTMFPEEKKESGAAAEFKSPALPLRGGNLGAGEMGALKNDNASLKSPSTAPPTGRSRSKEPDTEEKKRQRLKIGRE